MGEHNIRFIRRAHRVLAAGVLAAGAVGALSSCSSLGLAASAEPAASSSAAVVDPSVQESSIAPSAATATAVPAVTPATGDSPTPTPVATATPAATAVTPFITLASSSGGGLSVSALVPKIVEQGGTCTVVATQGAVTRQAESAAAPVSSYTGCNPLAIPASALTRGAWTVQVSYRSAISAGASKPQTVQVG